jgi:UDP-N-acetylmuramyl-tripeptide synthetase
MYKSGVKVVAMEVSAHALYYDKINDVKFEVGVLTNFTQDHLDFFGNMDDYKLAKKKLFENDRCKYKVVNADDGLGMELMNCDSKTISYGIDNPSDVFAIEVECDDIGSQFVINIFDMIYNVDLNLIGKFNVYNAMAGATATALVGVPTESIIRGLCAVKTVSGRLELVHKSNYSVYIDYAHTPDGLEKSLTALRDICKGKLICVFGCGGNRDKEKRPLMGKISGEKSDFTVITSDNPRFEDPMEVISEIENGLLTVSRNYVVVQEREDGIKYALDYAKNGDVVIIAGKGSEKYQEVLGIKHVYNDKDTVKRLVEG